MKHPIIITVLSIMVLVFHALRIRRQNAPVKKLSIREQLEQLNAAAKPASVPMPQPVVRKLRRQKQRNLPL